MKSKLLIIAGILCACLTASAQSGTPVDLPYTENFRSLPTTWSYQSNNQGQIRVRDGRMLLDGRDRGTYALNQAILHVNLQNMSEVFLTFDHQSHSDEDHVLPETFRGAPQGDGLAVSVDGDQWYRVTSFVEGVNRVDLSTFLRSKNITPGANTRLNFLQYDNYPANIDGRSFDSLTITSGPSCAWTTR